MAFRLLIGFLLASALLGCDYKASQPTKSVIEDSSEHEEHTESEGDAEVDQPSEEAGNTESFPQGDEVEDSGGEGPNDMGGEDSVPSPTDPSSVRMFVFGHSLIVHEHTPEPTEEKKVPHWLHHFAQTDGNEFLVDGQYGFLPQHADFSNLSPQWGFADARSLWTDERVPFANIDYSHIMITPANFIQYQGPDVNYWNSNQTPIDATLQILDQSRASHPNSAFYIYENWPDMGGYGSFPNGVDIEKYHRDTSTGAFHNWFLQYQDILKQRRPGVKIRMIPTGPVISKLLSETALSGIPLTSIYEDDAPHGQLTLYFLASVVTYTALYKKAPPANFNIPNTVHPLVRQNFAMIRSFVLAELEAFNDSNGNSRVF